MVKKMLQNDRLFFQGISYFFQKKKKEKEKVAYFANVLFLLIM